MASKPIKILELPYSMMQFLIITFIYIFWSLSLCIFHSDITCIMLQSNCLYENFLSVTTHWWQFFSSMKIVFIQTSSFAGLHDNLHEGRFKWFDGLRFQHGVCVPVHANGGHTENCIAWSIEKPEGCWEDRRCYEKIPYTCRIPVEGDSHYPLTPANITITSILAEHYYANTFIADHYNWELPLKDLKAVCKFLIVHKLY